MREYAGAVKEFFTHHQWKEMDKQEQHVYLEIFYKYLMCLELGIKVVTPDFMNIAEIEGKSIFPCKFCNAFYSTEVLRSSHEPKCRKRFLFQVDNSKKHSCPHCNYTTDVLKHITSHIRTHFSDKPFVCEFCNKGFNQKNNLQKHVKALHIKSQTYRCTECAHFTQCVDSFKAHKKTHSLTKRFTCPVCSKGFNRKRDLESHIYKHSEDKNFPFPCSMCEKSFTREPFLDQHMKTVHLKVKDLKCPYCNFLTGYGSSLRKHVNKHFKAKEPPTAVPSVPRLTKEKTFTCKLCDFSTTIPQNLPKHMETHKVEAPAAETRELKYTCELCNVGYNRIRDYHTHMIRNHDNEGTFPCNLCEKSFRDKDILKHHVKSSHYRRFKRTKEDQEEISCQYCSYSAPSKPALKSHQTKKHKEHLNFST